MKEIENSPKSSKFLIYCTVKSGSVEKSKKHIKIIERAIILHAQAEGHELFNKKGTKLPTDVISFNGNRTSEAIAPRKMLIKKALV
jgi:ssRNA-specific RNase YbeY (16S rRNA maturation enzyme)